MKLKTTVYSVIAAILLLCNLLLIAPMNNIASATESEVAHTEESLPSQYCMRDEYILYAQNQDSLGYCWNFAAMMSASTTIMKATGEYYDFSELWTGVALNVCTKNHDKIGKGGSITYQYNAMKQSGLMLETDLPYQYSYTVSDENAEDYYNFYERYSNDDLASCLISDKDTSFMQGEVEEIKKHIYNHGSVYLTFTFKTGFIEHEGVYCLEPNQKDTNSNHAISIIGWDDNYEREFYLNGSTTPTVFKGAWIVLNSYAEKNSNDGIAMIFYDDDNIGTIQGYRYETDTDKDFYFYDKIESGYSYPTSLKGKYYGDLTAETTLTKQKNIFYDDVNLEYSYIAPDTVGVEKIDIYLDGHNVTDGFDIGIDNSAKSFYVSKNNAVYGQYKLLVTYGNGEKSDTYLNNFFVTHGLFGEEIEYDYDNSQFAFTPGRDLEFHSFINTDKNYVIYTNKLNGEIKFIPTEQSIYSEKDMSMPSISYEITNGKGCTSTYKIKSNTGYELEYNFIFEYYDDTTLKPVNVYYDLGGGQNHSENYRQELAGPESDLILYEPTRPGYTFAGWYLDYGNGSKKISERDGVYYVSWEDIHHMGETPGVYASSYYKQYYNNSSTLFVYARWEEEEYYNVDISIVGEGASQIDESISLSSDDSVRYFFTPKSGWCLTGLTVNGEGVVGDELVEAIKYGLVIKNLDEDTSIVATFSEGVYLSIKFGDNVKSAYIVGTKNGKTQNFYDGEFIPSEYFEDFVDRFDPILPEKDPIISANKQEEINLPGGLLPALPFPGFGNQFTLVVEVFDDENGYTYIIDNAISYTVIEKGKYSKKYVIGINDKIKEIDVGSATRTLIESVDVTYSVNSYVEDHYISADINAKSGDKYSATFDAGQVVYLFIKKPDNTAMYRYTVPDYFTMIGNGWYRKAICVSSAEHDLGMIRVSRGHQTYTVTWKNWDGSVLYTEDYLYGDTPVFDNNNTTPSDRPVKPNDAIYNYVFVGWDTELRDVSSNVTYTAVYEAVLRQYNVCVEPTENGTVTPDGNNTINYFDRHTYIFTPEPGYKVKDVILNGESIGTPSSYTFSEITCDQTLLVEFERIKYPVNVICGDNGSTDPSGVVQVEHGSSITINITPNELFGIDFIKVNGQPVEITDSLSVEDIKKEIFIEIAFKQVKFNITTTDSGKGNQTSTRIVSIGESARVEFSAKFGYIIKDVIIDGVSIGAVDHYTFVNVDRDHTISVEHAVNIPLVVILSLAGAALIGSATALVVVRLRKKRLQPVTSADSPETKIEGQQDSEVNESEESKEQTTDPEH